MACEGAVMGEAKATVVAADMEEAEVTNMEAATAAEAATAVVEAAMVAVADMEEANDAEDTEEAAVATER